MRKLFISALILAVASGAQAQTHKCIGSDGKITYSDFICGKDTAAESGVRTDANTIDTSGYRKKIVKEQAEQRAAQVAEAKKKKEDPCATHSSRVIPTAAESKASIECLNSHKK